MSLDEMLRPTYWYEGVHILELMYFYINLNKDKNKNVKYIELYIQFDHFEKVKLFVSQMNMIKNAVDLKYNVAVVCHLNGNHYTALYLKTMSHEAHYIDSLGYRIPYQLRSCILKMGFNEPYDYTDFVQQSDGSNCGPFTCFNLVLLINEANIRTVPIPDVNKLRQAQHGVFIKDLHFNTKYELNDFITDSKYLLCFFETNEWEYTFLPIINGSEDYVYAKKNKKELQSPKIQAEMKKKTIDFNLISEINILEIGIYESERTANNKDLSDKEREAAQIVMDEITKTRDNFLKEHGFPAYSPLTWGESLFSSGPNKLN